VCFYGGRLLVNLCPLRAVGPATIVCVRTSCTLLLRRGSRHAASSASTFTVDVLDQHQQSLRCVPVVCLCSRFFVLGQGASTSATVGRDVGGREVFSMEGPMTWFLQATVLTTSNVGLSHTRPTNSVEYPVCSSTARPAAWGLHHVQTVFLRHFGVRLSCSKNEG